MAATVYVTVLIRPIFKNELAGMEESRGSLEVRISELTRQSEELHSDNRRMAELLVTSEGENREVADVMERLTQERKDLLRQCQEHRQTGVQYVCIIVTIDQTVMYCMCRISVTLTKDLEKFSSQCN